RGATAGRARATSSAPAAERRGLRLLPSPPPTAAAGGPSRRFGRRERDVHVLGRSSRSRPSACQPAARRSGSLPRERGRARRLRQLEALGGWPSRSVAPHNNFESESNRQTPRVLAVMPPPLICLDPGHGTLPAVGRQTEPIGPGSSQLKIKDGGGTAGEAPVALAIALKTRALLKGDGYRVAMTRTGRTYAGGNIARARFCNVRHAALMIRIHADGATDR